MYKINVRNVNEALVPATKLLNTYGRPISPRGEATLELSAPTCTTYTNPRERVMLHPERDANPFFHLFESLWILAGRQDVAWLAQFNKRMRDYSDDGEVFHAAYGYRLRNALTEGGYTDTTDQIELAIHMLKKSAETRRCVLQIWNHELDLCTHSKDIPCNDLIFLKIRDGILNMTVCCRSNDMLWGAYGANVVQFSILQEYIADKVGVEVGVYNQVSDSFHVYTDNPLWGVVKELPYSDFNPYRYDVEPYPINANEEGWDKDLHNFMEHAEPNNFSVIDQTYNTAFFNEVVKPMWICWAAHKIDRDGLSYTQDIKATDWRMAATQWLEKREEV